MSARLATLPRDASLQRMQAHLCALQQAGHEIVLITTNMPCATLVGSMEAVDFDRVHVIDAVSETGVGQLSHPGTERVTMIASATMLELIAMRTERVARSMKDPYVVVCCLNTLAVYNDVQSIEQFTRFLANRLAGYNVPVDFILREGDDDAARLGQSARQCVDQELPVLLA